MILFIDTETTGKADFRAGYQSPTQPRIVQLAALVTDDASNTLGMFSTLIEPDGWTVPDDAARIHGISTARCQEAGMPIANALASLVYLATKCKTVVAHNLDFDAMMIASECHRLGQSSLINHVQHECTMKIATPFCKLPGRYGDYKWPSLAETHRHFFGTEVQGAHDAMADVLACARCYFEIKKLLAAKPNNPAEAIETDTMSA